MGKLIKSYYGNVNLKLYIYMYINVEFCFSYIVYYICNKLVIRIENMVYMVEINYDYNKKILVFYNLI